VDDPVWFELLSVDRLTVDKAVDTRTVVDTRPSVVAKNPEGKIAAKLIPLLSVTTLHFKKKISFPVWISLTHCLYQLQL
jgi:hypothetical protein